MRTTVIPALALLLLAGCSDQEAVGPLAENHSVVAAGAVNAATPDISGVWQQERDLFIHLAAWAAPMFGVTPEGERTTLRCSATGTVEFVQDGAAFTATYTEQGECSTPGGQTVQVGGAGTMDGTISGRSIAAMAIGHPGPVECPQRGSIRVVNGAAVEISGMAHCIEPGHPQSLVQVPLPRAGPNHTRWVMYR
jgi:hypothetical protein